MSRLLHSEIALSALMVCLLVLAHAAGKPAVLCVADPGHIAVEALESACCSRSCAGEGFYAADSECGGCTDIPLETMTRNDGPRRGADTIALPASDETVSLLPPDAVSRLPLAVISAIEAYSPPLPLLRC